MRETIEDLELSRDVTQAICEANGYYNPDYKRYTKYINDMKRELATMEEREDLAICEAEAIIRTMRDNDRPHV